MAAQAAKRLIEATRASVAARLPDEAALLAAGYRSIGDALRLAGVLVNGRCFPSGTLRPTPPMLHVWLADHPCGPFAFAGIEGHGGGCAHGHAN